MRAAGERPERKAPDDGASTEPEWHVDQAAWDAAGAWADDDTPDDAPAGPFAVWPENWPTVLLFWRVRRCWVISPGGNLVSMDWAQVRAKAELIGLRARRKLAREVARLELMEEAVLEEMGRE